MLAALWFGFPAYSLWATWSPTNKAPNIKLSSGDLVASL